jgi:hypothetical protein
MYISYSVYRSAIKILKNIWVAIKIRGLLLFARIYLSLLGEQPAKDDESLKDSNTSSCNIYCACCPKQHMDLKIGSDPFETIFNSLMLLICVFVLVLLFGKGFPSDYSGD